ncbi:hypothetical protein ES708_14138 [subsurface metagenome]
MIGICINWKNRPVKTAFTFRIEPLNLFARIFPIILICIGLNGCGLKPSSSIPTGITVSQAIDAIEKQSSHIRDFTGKAFVKASIGSSPEQTVNVSVKYLRPDNFRLNVKGFAGITVAVISAVSDSITIYFPSENAFLALGRKDSSNETTLSDALTLFIPELKIKPERIAAVFNGTLPTPFNREHFRASIKSTDRQAVLTLENGPVCYRYTLEGPELMVVEEEILEDGISVWHKYAASFQSLDEVLFPQIIRITEGEGKVSLEFSDYAINSGLNEDDCTFAVPESAGRMIIEKN